MPNAVTGTTIAKNATFYAAALTLQKALSFVYFTILARSLGVDLTGKYFFALSFAGIVMGIVDIGLTPALTREVAKDTSRAASFLFHTLSIKVCIAIIMASAGIAVSTLFHDPVQQGLLVIAMVIAFLDSIALSIFATIRAHQNLLYESVSAVLFQAIVISTGTVALFFHADVRIVICALLVGSTVNLGFGALMLYGKLKVPTVVQYEAKMFQRLAILAAPFAIAAICIKANAYTDTVLVKLFLTDHAVGLYSVAYKVTFAFQFIPMAFVAALYPAFAYFWQHDRVRLAGAFTGAYKYLLMFSVPIVAGIAALADKIIPFVYTPAYLESVAPLIILMLSLPLLFINFPIGSLLNAVGRQNRQTTHLAIGVVVTIFFNLSLIPILGITGAALASTLSTVMVFILGIYVAHTIIRFDIKALLLQTLNIACAGLLCFLIARGMSAVMPWYMSVAPAAIGYLAILWFTKLIDRSVFSQLRSMVRR